MKLDIKHLSVFLNERQILSDIHISIEAGTVHVLMGPNGSGKSTFASALMGHPSYEVRSTDGKTPAIMIGTDNLVDLPPEERARAGLFLAFQNPTGIPGVTVANLLRTAYLIGKGENTGKKATATMMEFNKMLLARAAELSIPKEFLRRGLNEEFSGGEKKKLEMLQALVLSPKFAIFDEIDTGLDVDALRIVAEGIDAMKKNGTGVLIITHYQRILRYARPDFVHILVDGKIVASGKEDMAAEVEKNGYKKWAI